MAVHQNLVYSTPESARSHNVGVLALTVCDSCGFVSNSAFDGFLLAYGEAYDNTQHLSKAFEEHLQARVDAVLASPGALGGMVVEVGCGKGDFLRRLVLGGAKRGLGYDPSYEGAESEEAGRLRFIKRFFGPEEGRGESPQAVVSRHVIEHVPAPLRFLEAIRAAMAEDGNARLFLETPCVDWIFEQGAYWDFFYEHCSYFTADALSLVLRRAGFRPLAINKVFGGQYLWAEAELAQDPEASWPTGGAKSEAAFDFARREAAWLETSGERLRLEADRGAVVVWGAGAKGVTFATLVDPEATLIDAIVDVNPRKQGAFLPGTGHSILSPEALSVREPHLIYVMNPNYLAEIESRVRSLGLSASLLPLQAMDDETGALDV